MRIDKNNITKCKNGTIKYGTKGYSVSRIKTIQWIEEYASLYGDRMPHTSEVLLPYKTRLRHVYQQYARETMDHVAENTFYKTWRNHFPNLKVKKTNSFSQCTKCASLQRIIDTTTSNEIREQLKKEKDLHNQRQMLERKCYYEKRDASKDHPEDYLSLIIDGMDQSKTDLPHFTGRQMKNINPAVLLKTHITGVICHGDSSFRAYLDLLEYPHDPNLTINVLLKTLIEISTEKGQLPETLYLQSDNCYRENKNKYVFGFCEYLVKKNIFKEVQISFLYTGHTHEDIDAAFSKIAQTLHVKDAENLDDLLQIIPNAKRLNKLYDVKSWLGDNLSKVKNITDPLHYKLTKKGVYVKGQQHNPWMKLDGIGSFLKTIPKGRPDILTPDFARIVEGKEKLKKQISDIKYVFTKPDKVIWWDEFLNGGYESMNSGRQTGWVSDLPVQKSKTIKQRPNVQIDEELRKMLEKESAQPRISCEGKRKKSTSIQHGNCMTKKKKTN